MRPLRMAAVLALVVIGAAGPAPNAAAGNWAVTLLDPVPGHFEAGHTYTIGYWVLQHGSHPFEGDLGRTGLRLVGPDKQELAFEGVALREPAHYAAAIALPANGSWRVEAMQGVFAEHHVGTLTIPGGLTIQQPDTPVDVGGHDHGHDGKTSHWGAIHPPGGVADGHGHDHEPASPAANAAALDTQTQSQARPDSPVMPALLAFGSAVVLLGLLLGVRPLRRRLRG